MKTFIFFFLFISFSLTAQEMTIEKLVKIITQQANSIQKNGSSYNFIYKDRMLICIADEKANRMRIISPITKRELL